MAELFRALDLHKLVILPVLLCSSRYCFGGLGALFLLFVSIVLSKGNEAFM